MSCLAEKSRLPKYPFSARLCLPTVLVIATGVLSCFAPELAHANEILGPADAFSLASQDDYARDGVNVQGDEDKDKDGTPIAIPRSTRMTQALEASAADSERLFLMWDKIAADCGGPTWDREDPDTGCYHWDVPDRAIQDALGSTALGRKPKTIVVSTRTVPCWLFRNPDAAACDRTLGSAWESYVGPSDDRARFNNEFAAFMVAAARRYDGSTMPKVTNWTVFNEPNSEGFWLEGPIPGPGDTPVSGNTPTATRACNYAQAYSAVVGRLEARGLLAAGEPRASNDVMRIALGPFSPNGSGANGTPELDPTSPQFTGALAYFNQVMEGAYVDGGGQLRRCFSADRMDAVSINAYASGNHPFTGRDQAEIYRSGRISLVNLEELREGTRPIGTNGRPAPVGADYPSPLDGMDSSDPRYSLTRNDPIWITETDYRHSPFQGDPNSPSDLLAYRRAELGQAAWLSASMQKAASNGVTFYSWYPMYSEEDGHHFAAGGLHDHINKGDAPYDVPGRRKPSVVTFENPVSIHQVFKLDPSTRLETTPIRRKAVGGRYAPVYEVFSYYHSSTPTLAGVTPMPVISTQCSQVDRSHSRSSWSLHRWLSVTNSPRLKSRVVPAPATGTMRRIEIWGDVLVPISRKQALRLRRLHRAGRVVERTIGGTTRYFTPSPLENTSFCLTQRVPKGSGVASGSLLVVQRKSRATRSALDPWMSTHHRTYVTVGGTPRDVIGNYLDEPYGHVVTPGPGRIRPTGSTPLASQFSLMAAPASTALGAPSLFSTAPSDDVVGLEVTETGGAEYLYESEDMDPAIPASGDEPEQPESSNPVVWYNPASSGSFRVDLQDPSDTWTEAYFPPIDALGWSDGGENAGPDFDPGRYASIYDGDSPSQTYSFSPKATAPDPVLASALADGDWGMSLPLSVTPDEDAPTDSAIRPRTQFVNTDEVVTDVVPGVDPDSGIRSWRVERRVRELAAPFVDYRGIYTPQCGLYLTDWTMVTSGTDSEPTEFDDTSVQHGRCYEYRLVVEDNVSNSVTVDAPFAVMVDQVAPHGQEFVRGERFVGEPLSRVDVMRGVDDGVGNDTYVLERQAAELTVAGCGTFDEFAVVPDALQQLRGINDTGRLRYDDTDIADAHCYRYRYTVTDYAGNSNTVESGVVKVDLQKPTGAFSIVPVAGLQWQYLASPTQLFVNNSQTGGAFELHVDGVESLSGVQFVQFPRLGTWQVEQTSDVLGRDEMAPYSVRYDWNAASSPKGTFPVTVASNAQVRDTALTRENKYGVLSTDYEFELVIDRAGPKGALLSVQLVGTDPGAQSVQLSITQGADAESGWLRSEVQRAVAVKTASGSCGTFGEFEHLVDDPGSTYVDNSVLLGRCYRYRLVEFDRVQNSTITTVNNPVVTAGTDPSAIPQAPSIAVEPHYSNDGTATLLVNPGTNPTDAVTWTVERRELELRKLSAGFEDWICARPKAWELVSTDTPAISTQQGLTEYRCYEYRLTVTYANGKTQKTTTADPVVIDMTPPGTTAIIRPTYDGRVTAADSVQVLVEGGFDLGVGTASRTLERSVGTLTLAGCTNFGDFEPLGNVLVGVARRNQYTWNDFDIDQGSCYRYRYTVYDLAGNASVQISNAFGVDRIPPVVTQQIVPVDAPEFQYLADDSTIFVNTRHTGSFDVYADAYALAGINTIVASPLTAPYTRSQPTFTAPTIAHYSWTGSANVVAPASGFTRTTSFAETGAANTGFGGDVLTTDTPFTIISDVTAPTGSTATAAAPTGASTSIVVATTPGVDPSTAGVPAAGIAYRALQRSDASEDANAACPAATSYDVIATDPAAQYTDTTSRAGHCYVYRYVERDAVGNESTVTTDTIHLPASDDTTPPATFAITAATASLPTLDIDQLPSTCQTTPARSGPTYEVAWTASTDADSGLASYEVRLDGSLVASVSPGTQSFDYQPSTPLAEGLHTWSVTATDNAGNQTDGTSTNPADTSDASLLVDRHAPTLAVSSPVGGTVANPVHVTWSAGDDNCIARVQVTIDSSIVRNVSEASGDYQMNLDSGTHVVSTTAIDSAGNTTVEQRVVTVDAAPPTISNLQITPTANAQYVSVNGATAYYNAAQSGSLRVSADVADDTGFATVTFPDIDGPLASAWSDGTSTTAAAGTFTHTYSWSAGATTTTDPLLLDAADLVDHHTTAAFSLIADTQPPVAGTITYPTGHTNATTTTISFATGTDSGAGIDPASVRIQRSTAPLTNGTCGTYESYVDIAVAPTGSTITDSSRGDGCHRYRLTYADRVSNAQTVDGSGSVLADSTPPTTRISIDGADQATTVSGTATDTASTITSIHVTYTGPTNATICDTTPTNGAWSCTWDTTALADGTYTVHATVTDSSANSRDVTASYVIDRIPDNTSGLLDTTYGDNGFAITDVGPSGGTVAGSTQLPNGNTLTAGTLLDSTGHNGIALTSHTPTGQLDTSFGTNGIATLPLTNFSTKVTAVTLDPSGRILVSADTYAYPPGSHVIVARFTSTGQADTTFGTNGVASFQPEPGTPRSISVQTDSHDRIVVGGYSQSNTNIQSFFATRLTPTGQLDTTFDSDGTALATYPNTFTMTGGYVAIQTDDKILITGNIYFTTPPEQADRNAAVVRFDTNGAVDTTYGTNGWYVGKPESQAVTVRRILLDTNNTATLGLACESGCGFGIARLTPDGQLDTTFGDNNDGSTFVRVTGTWTQDYDLVLTDTGLFVVAGRSGTTSNSQPNIAMARFDDNGDLDTTYGTNGYTITTTPLGSIETISATQAPTGNIIVAGTLTPTTGTKKYLLASYTN